MIDIRACLVGVLALSAAALTAPSLAQAARTNEASSTSQASHSKKHPEASSSPKPASGATRSLGTFDGWTAYASADKTGRVCYLVGQPQKSEPAGSGRKTPMAMVTHRPAEKITNVVSFVAGYPLKDGSDVALDVGGSKFELFTKDDGAWARTAELDKSIVTTLAKGQQAVVKGVPQKGPATTDIYPLAGFAKALALIDKACGVQREEKPNPGGAPRPAHRKHRRP
jgi:invasion associated locus B (IalB) protein